jgi:hypothetical protein
VLAAVAAAGCGGEPSKPAAPAEAVVRASGAGRHVDARMEMVRVVDPAHNELLRAAAGTRFVQLDVRWRNLAGDPLPIEWARFAVLDQNGASHPEHYRLPERVLRHGFSASPRVVPVGFELPDEARPVAVTMTSAVAGLPLRGRWPLPVG